MITVLETTIPYLAFNDDTTFSAANAVININSGDKLLLKIVNTDTAIHSVQISYGERVPLIIAPNQAKTIILTFLEQGVHLLYDPTLVPNYKYLGLAAMICVKAKIPKREFYWNLKEHQTAYNQNLAAGKKVDWITYNPEFFTINGASFPLIHDDATAKIYGKVGDTINIYIANTGQSLHSIHFHGFHCKVIASTNRNLIHTEKDTFPLRSMDTMVLQMIPDKRGEYAVHDHNLMANTAKLRHPSGMMLIMLIE